MAKVRQSIPQSRPHDARPASGPQASKSGKSGKPLTVGTGRVYNERERSSIDKSKNKGVQEFLEKHDWKSVKNPNHRSLWELVKKKQQEQATLSPEAGAPPVKPSQGASTLADELSKLKAS